MAYATVINVGGVDYTIKDTQARSFEFIGTKLISLQKDTYTLALVSGFDVVSENGYMEYNGNIVYSDSHKVMRLADSTVKKILFSAFTSEINFATVIVKNGSTVVSYYSWDTTEGYILNLPSLDFDAIYFNFWNANTGTPAYDLISVLYEKGIAFKENIENGFNVASAPWADLYGKTAYFKFDDIIGVADGYLNAESTTPIGTTHKHILFPAKYVKKISMTGSTVPLVHYALYYERLNSTGIGLIGGSTSGEYEFDLPHNGYIAINYFRDSTNSYAKGFTLEFWPQEYVNEQSCYTSSVRKPFDFYGKTAVFVGDSITVGFTSGSTTTQNNYPKLFSEAVGLTYTNKAVGGALFCAGHNEVKTIPLQVSEILTAPDFLFIAGGVNDWSMGATALELRSTISNLCDYITTNMPNTEVIWITPINSAKLPIADTNYGTYGYLKNYSDLIFEEVKKKDVGKFSIVCGFDFGFPNPNSPAAYKSAMFGDLLHPSELGYSALYVPGLLNALQ